MSDQKEKTIFTAKEAVEEYFEGTISYWKLLQDFHAGKIPGKQMGKRILFRKEALDKWFDGETPDKPSPDPDESRPKYRKVNRF